MASVIRVKRRRGEDPAEALLLSCKRLRTTDVDSQESKIESVLSFAGTTSSKSEPVSAHVREAIKQRKLNPNSGRDIKHAHHKPNLASRMRGENAQASHNSRYRILSGKRALDLAELDTVDAGAGNISGDTSKQQVPLASDKAGHDTPDARLSDDKVNSSASCDNKENSSATSNVSSQSEDTAASVYSQNLPSETSYRSKKNDEGAEELGESREFCLLDVEHDSERNNPPFLVSQQSASGITVNNVPMVCRKAEPEPTDDSQFVYDIYYTHSNLADLDLQAALTVEALCEAAFVPERDEGEDCYVHEDSDDSNDENNWRNDYPDEDPHFFENEDYDYEEDMVDTGYMNDDETDLLTYWMGSRCNVESRSDDDEDEYEDD